MTITPEVVMGYLRTPETWWFIEPLRKFRARARPQEYLVYRAEDVIMRLDMRHDAIPGRLKATDDESGTIPPTIGLASVMGKGLAAR